MNAALLVSNLALLVGVLGLSFLVLGALRALGVLTWRLDQLEAMRPSRIGREGLKVGRNAPDFTLPCVSERSLANHQRGRVEELALKSLMGRKVLLVLTQSGCGPCMAIVPELNRLHDRGEYQVIVVNNGEPQETQQWAVENKARFRVLAQEKFGVSKRYEVFVTPFAFLIDEQGIIVSKGIAGSKEYLGYVLSRAHNRPEHHETEPAEAKAGDSALSEPESRTLLPTDVAVHV